MAYDNILDAIIQFYLDNPQKCLKILQTLQTKDQNELKQKDIFMYRSYISQNKFRVPLDEIHPSASISVELKSVRLLAEYLSDARPKDEIVRDMEVLLNGKLEVDNDTTLIMAANIYLHEAHPEQALKVLHNGNSLECQAMSIQALLQMHRFDVAQKELKKMLDSNEDDLLTQLSLAMVNISMGGEKLTEAYNIYQEMSDKYKTTTSMILNGKAAAMLGLGKLEDADSILQEAMDKNSNDPSTLINMIVLSQMSGKSFEDTNRYLSQLRDSHCNHPFVRDYLNKEAEFSRIMEGYCATLAN